MKVSYRTHPVLGLINGYKNNVKIDSREPKLVEILSGLNYIFDTYKNKLNENIILVSNSFVEAANSCRNKMIDNSLYKEIGDNLSGVLLFGNMSIVYKAKRVIVGGVGAWKLNIINFFNGDSLGTFYWEGFTHSDMLHDGLSPIDAAKGAWSIVQMVLMFKKFADVEIKELPAGQKVKDIECKYINETQSNVTLLTSTWFTTLVKSDAFKVRGHFRLQPKKKDGVWTKELIWINDFEKTGYTAPAKILSNP